MSARNPFRPTFGVSPTVLAGRDSLLQSFKLGLAEGPGSPFRALLISGSRGMGKTVLLNEFEDAAASQGWITLRAYPDNSMVDALVNSAIPEALQNLDGPQSKRMLSGVAIPGIATVTAIADPTKKDPTPTLISKLRELATRLQKQGSGILITLDELQSANVGLLHVLATAVQDLLRDDFDIALVAAGLPEGIDRLLQHEGTTFIRRAERILLNPVNHEDSVEMFLDTAAEGQRHMTSEAAELAAQISKGYPYSMQLTGSLAWARSTLDNSDTIQAEQVDAVRDEVVRRMGMQVHEPSLHQVPDGELTILYAIAQLSKNGEMVSTGDIAHLMGVKPNALSMQRKQLLSRGLVEVPKYGFLNFTLPYMREHLLNSPHHRPIT
ncbi:AAA family ATPase [Corynebacterium glutamicum]|uniref:AAA family ATPase n=1 Tax=Corynebacterium TaxID=1716 RepID=UPI00071FB6FD|nr:MULTISPECIES: AAA family ATPase [Corynebacterium]ALP49939.1 hypothetical protein AC079_06815 [Corynebacterium glutamicum]ANR62300.1 hypothetical protein C628_06675 [[Brevibacterium] flavum ZL-1]ANR65304.1 hypothetical protein C627_06645 [Corynebacterium glutamicum ZL-6]ANU33453.1 hypothetical protein BBD29_06615 [Corynebacterium glutamicum]APT07202.1 hypothetical protein BSP99_06800 [Corynebacterium glutamicum]